MKLKHLYAIPVLLAIAIIASCGKADLDSDTGKYSYVIGFNIGSNVKKDDVTLDINSFVSGVEDALNAKESRLTPDQAQAAMQKLMLDLRSRQMKGAGENKVKGDTFLAENQKKEGVKTTATGLQYRVLKAGSGRKPGPADTVTVHYAGKLIDGTEFDSSYKRNEPIQLKLDGVIRGWAEGLQMMNVGSKYELVIPSDIGYGPQGNQTIPGNSVLVFEVELLKIGK